MKDNKYYTPDISDLHIGYEGEYLAMITPQTRVWKPFKIEDSFSFNEIWDIFNEGKQTNIKVKYLSKEDIESEGWKDLENHPKLVEQHYSQGKHRLVLNQITRGIEVYTINFVDTELSPPIQIYKGECKSINELKKLMKSLSINYDISGTSE